MTFSDELGAGLPNEEHARWWGEAQLAEFAHQRFFIRLVINESMARDTIARRATGEPTACFVRQTTRKARPTEP